LGTEELVKLAAENGANALAITNINNTSDVWDFVECYPRLAFPGVFSTFSK
jgi:DNA polymerase III alpha subunit